MHDMHAAGDQLWVECAGSQLEPWQPVGAANSSQLKLLTWVRSHKSSFLGVKKGPAAHGQLIHGEHSIPICHQEHM
jgi:hypothetical protein